MVATRANPTVKDGPAVLLDPVLSLENSPNTLASFCKKISAISRNPVTARVSRRWTPQNLWRHFVVAALQKSDATARCVGPAELGLLQQKPKRHLRERASKMRPRSACIAWRRGLVASPCEDPLDIPRREALRRVEGVGLVSDQIAPKKIAKPSQREGPREG